MAERENKKSLKDRAQDIAHDVVQGVAEVFEVLFPSPAPQLVPVRISPRPQRVRRRR